MPSPARLSVLLGLRRKSLTPGGLPDSARYALSFPPVFAQDMTESSSHLVGFLAMLNSTIVAGESE